MSVKLEKYLNEKRRLLDAESPDDNLIWKGIQGRLHNEDREIRRLNNRIRFLRIRNIAATAIILFSLGYIANDLVNRKNKVSQLTLSTIDSELGRREREYQTLVNYKTIEVSSFNKSQDVEINQLFAEIRDLDKIYDQAMKDLQELGPNDRVINIIFSTYEQKIRLLEMIILQTNKINSHENNEKTIL